MACLPTYFPTFDGLAPKNCPEVGQKHQSNEGPILKQWGFYCHSSSLSQYEQGWNSDLTIILNFNEFHLLSRPGLSGWEPYLSAAHWDIQGLRFATRPGTSPGSTAAARCVSPERSWRSLARSCRKMCRCHGCHGCHATVGCFFRGLTQKQLWFIVIFQHLCMMI